MSNGISLGHKEITVLGNKDILEEEGLYKQVELKFGEIIYRVVNEEILEHWSNGYCHFL